MTLFLLDDLKVLNEKDLEWSKEHLTAQTAATEEKKSTNSDTESPNKPLAHTKKVSWCCITFELGLSLSKFNVYSMTLLLCLPFLWLHFLCSFHAKVVSKVVLTFFVSFLVGSTVKITRERRPKLGKSLRTIFGHLARWHADACETKNFSSK